MSSHAVGSSVIELVRLLDPISKSRIPVIVLHAVGERVILELGKLPLHPSRRPNGDDASRNAVRLDRRWLPIDRER
jgi:hypothetical protein